MLRNPNLVYNGFDVPNNVYDIGSRIVYEKKDNAHTVKIFVVCFKSSDKIYRLNSHDYTLKGLPGDPTLLVPSLYQSELIIQHGEEELDGTLIKDFEVL